MVLGPKRELGWALGSLEFVQDFCCLPLEVITKPNNSPIKRGGWGGQPPHLQNPGKQEATNQKSKRPKDGDAGVLLAMLRMRKAEATKK